jgi:endonuclease YncB( thermonuclease family)
VAYSTDLPGGATTESPDLETPGTPTSVPLAQDAWCIPWNAEAVYGRVLRVIDGVTIEVDLGGQPAQVRYIGVDLLDYSQDEALWGKMTAQNAALVDGKNILLIKDRSEADADGRLWRYVFADSVFVNYEMVSNGYAIATSTPPDTSCDALFLEAEQQAILAENGLWAPESTPTRTILPYARPTTATSGNIVIIRVAYRGTPWQEPEEYAEIYNAGDQAVQLQGWSLRDRESHIYIFPRFVLRPGDYCRVFTDLYNPRHCGFTYNNPGPIWDNDGDCAYLKDSDGLLMNTYCYD